MNEAKNTMNSQVNPTSRLLAPGFTSKIKAPTTTTKKPEDQILEKPPQQDIPNKVIKITKQQITPS